MIEYSLAQPRYARKLVWMYNKIAEHEKITPKSAEKEVQYAVRSIKKGYTVGEFVAEAREYFELNAKNPPRSSAADGK